MGRDALTSCAVARLDVGVVFALDGYCVDLTLTWPKAHATAVDVHQPLLRGS